MSVDSFLIVLGGGILALGLPSEIIKRLWLSVPLVALAAGVLVGPDVLGLLDPQALSSERRALEELARVTLAISLVGTALQITRSDLRAVWRRAASLLTVGMAGMWLLTSLGAHLLLDLPLWMALLLGGILTPTDPVVAASLVSGRLAEASLPRALRRSLQVEAGANDGLALAFVLIPALTLAAGGGGAATIAGEVLGQVAIAIAVGGALGYMAAKLVDVAEDHAAAATGFFFISALALALLILGAVHALGGTGVLGAFAGGLAFSLTLEEDYRDELEQVQDALEKVVLVPVFVLFGAVLPWDEWAALGWAGPAFALWALVLRRPPAAALALAPTRTSRHDAAFLSWYGPIGVAAIYYVLFVEQYRIGGYERLHAAGTLAIAVSIVAFSITATPGVRRRGRRRALTTLRHPLAADVERAP